MLTERKETRINIRVSKQQDKMFREVAQLQNTSVSDFILRTATEDAAKILADQRWFTLPAKEYDEFIERLEKRTSENELAKLFTRSIFDTPFVLED
ncbi:DUF1778 domain-containing protein [Arcanobacterium phocae]|uniref:type II toxin-antitoxin system TacA family antitoxin n=1 Tax=Arcanobacterium phocae TaxID=131112 RepID=UPI001C0EEE03|nr:DUF1778 domain-containing protein [Arcanobacterium phocae]